MYQKGVFDPKTKLDKNEGPSINDVGKMWPFLTFDPPLPLRPHILVFYRQKLTVASAFGRPLPILVPMSFIDDPSETGRDQIRSTVELRFAEERKLTQLIGIQLA